MLVAQPEQSIDASTRRWQCHMHQLQAAVQTRESRPAPLTHDSSRVVYVLYIVEPTNSGSGTHPTATPTTRYIPSCAARLSFRSPPRTRTVALAPLPFPATPPARRRRTCTPRQQPSLSRLVRQAPHRHPMALLLLRGCAAPPAVHAAPAGSRLLPPALPRRRLVAVASSASPAPSGEVASSSQDGRGYGTVGGPNGHAMVPATDTKSTAVETTVERVRVPVTAPHHLLHPPSPMSV